MAKITSLLRSRVSDDIKRGLMACTKLPPGEAAVLVISSLPVQRDSEIAAALARFLLSLKKEDVLEAARSMAASSVAQNRSAVALALGILPWPESGILLSQLKGDSAQDVAKIAAMSIKRLMMRTREISHSDRNLDQINAGSGDKGISLSPQEARTALASNDFATKSDMIRKMAECSLTDLSQWVLDSMINSLKNEKDEKIAASMIMSTGMMCGRIINSQHDKSGMAAVLRAAEVLAPYLDSPNTRIRANAVEALSNTGSREFWPLIATCLSDPNNRTRANAILGLKNCRWIDTGKYLKEMIASCERLMQLSAVWTIGMLQREELVSLLTDERLAADEAVCEKTVIIAEDLSEHGFQSAKTIPELMLKLRKQVVSRPAGSDDLTLKASAANGEQKRVSDSKAGAAAGTGAGTGAETRAATEVPGGTGTGGRTITTSPAAIESTSSSAADTGDETLLHSLQELIEKYTNLGLDEKKQIIFTIRNSVDEVHFNFLTYISRLHDRDMEALIHLALRGYEGTGFRDITNRLSGLSTAPETTEEQIWGVQNIGLRQTMSTLQLNRELSEREKTFKKSGDWGGKLESQIQMLNALREDTQDMILAAVPAGQRIERAYMCFYNEKFGFFEDGKKSLDSSKVIMSLKKNISAFDTFSPTGELLWSIPQPRYLLCLITTSNVILFLRSGLDESRACTKSFYYDYIDGIQVRSKGPAMDVNLKMGEKSITIPELSPANAREFEDLITVALA